MFESDIEDGPQRDSSEEEISDTAENTSQFELAEWAVNYGISSSGGRMSQRTDCLKATQHPRYNGMCTQRDTLCH